MEPVNSGNNNLGMNPSSYFPTSHRSSFSSHNSVLPDFEGKPQRPQMPSRTHTEGTTSSTAPNSRPQTPRPRTDALSRQFPKPNPEATLDEMLARAPQKWSLGHYLKNAKEARMPARDPEARAKEFADTKRDLLRAKDEMKNMGVGRR